jgi:hypothetical protein
LLSLTSTLLFSTGNFLSPTGIIRVFLLEFAVNEGKFSVIDRNIAFVDRIVAVGDSKIRRFLRRPRGRR